MNRPWSWRWAALGTALAAFALRLYRVAAESFSADEAFDLVEALNPLPVLWDHSRTYFTYPPLQHFLLHLWTAAAGTSELAVRYLPAALSTLAVAVVGVLGRRLLGRRTGLLAMVLLATSPFHIFYAQDARMYSLLSLGSVAATYAAVRLLDRAGSVRWGLAYVVAMAVTLYSHYYAYLALAALNLYAGLRLLGARRPGGLARWLGWQLGALALYAPWLAVSLGQDWGGTGWIPRPSPSLGSLTEHLALTGVRFLYVDRSTHFYDLRPGGLATALALAGLSLALLGVVAGLARSGRRSPAVLLGALVLVPPLLAYGVSVGLRPIYLTRGLIISLPALVLLVAWGLRELLARPDPRFPALGAVTALLLATLALISLRNLYTLPQNQSWREAAGYVQARASESDLVVVTPEWVVRPFGLYYDGPASVVAVSTEQDRQVAPQLPGRTRVWSVASLWEGTDEWLARRGYRLEERRDFYLVVVRSYRPPP